MIHDLWRHLPEQVRLRPEGSGDLRRFTGLLQETRGLCIKLQQDCHHASHSKADTAFHSLSWHAAVLRLAEMPTELQGSGQRILETAITIPGTIQAGLEQAVVILNGIEAQPLLGHVERSFVQLAGERTGLAERWLQIHPLPTEADPSSQAEELSNLREELAILHDRFAALSGAIDQVLNRLGDDMEGLSHQLRELMVLQPQHQQRMQIGVRTPCGGDDVDLGSGLLDNRMLTRIEGSHDQQRHNQLSQEYNVNHRIRAQPGLDSGQSQASAPHRW